IAFLAGIYRVFTHLPKIRDSHARHRIELDSGLDDRPLAALDDELAAGNDDPMASLLWKAHRDRMAAATQQLRLKMPAAGLARFDRWGLRAALVLALIVGAVAAGRDSGNRILNSLVPEINSGSLAKVANLNIWITPPAYTELPPILLDNGVPASKDAPGSSPENPIRIPAGSALLAQVAGGGTQPVLKIDETETEFGRVEADAYHVETELTAASRITVRQRGRDIGSWTVVVVPDEKPLIEFTDAPESTARLRLRLPFKASDDYGLKTLTASIRRIDGVAIPGGSDEMILPLPLPGQGKNGVTIKSSHDLTGHVWAGLPVLIHLIATDELGQIGLSTVEPAVLPERRFSQPVARELVDIRKKLQSGLMHRRLAQLKIDNVMQAPERFNNDNAAYLSMRIARDRLIQKPVVVMGVTDFGLRSELTVAPDSSKELKPFDPKIVADVQKMLWDIALRIEDGITSIASRDLAEAQKALQEALKNGASPEELERLMAEVQRAMDRFLKSLAEQLQQRGELTPLDENQRILGSDELQKLLDQARELMRQGSKEAAQQLMAELQRMLENLQRGLARRGGQQQQMSEQQRQQQREAQQAMRELRDIIRRQQELLDKTFKRSEDRGDAPMNDEKKEQNDIRRQLGKMMQQLGDRLGKVPEGLGRAEREMRESERALGQGQPQAAVGPQTKALEELRRGAQSAARGLARQLGRGQGRGQQFGQGRQFGPGGQFGRFSGPQLRGLRQGNRDPFGRPTTEEGNQGTATGTVKIPGESELKRAREILDELRRRAGDLWRPEIELEYIERLLKRF
ncbi:MAG: DUF4175 family protein, partial [Proteobacteria bacterium]|nr:DUF4175 family protein [Pseudomonadota bacterium]